MNVKQSFKLTLATGAVMLAFGACSPEDLVPTVVVSDDPTSVVEERPTRESDDDIFTCKGTVLTNRGSLYGSDIDIDRDCVPGDHRKDGPYVTCNSGDGFVTTDAAYAETLGWTDCVPLSL